MAARAEQQPHPRQPEPVPTGFDVFVLLLSILSLLNIIIGVVVNDQDVLNVVLVVDGVICLFFFGDFLKRFRRAPSKRGYLIGDKGWLDLLGSLPVPGLRLARLFRVARVTRAVRQRGLRGIARSATADRAGSSLLAAVFLTIVVLQYGSMAILGAEEDAEGSNIRTASDALWWSYVTITTVGYGDRYPVSNLGRNIGVGVLTIGVGLFGVLTGFLANLFLAPKHAQDPAPAETGPDFRAELDELRRLIAELRRDVPGGAAATVPVGGLSEAVAPAAPMPGRLDHDRI